MNQTGNAQYTVPKIVLDTTSLYPYLVFLKLPEEVCDTLEDHEKNSTALGFQSQQRRNFVAVVKNRSSL